MRYSRRDVATKLAVPFATVSRWFRENAWPLGLIIVSISERRTIRGGRWGTISRGVQTISAADLRKLKAALAKNATSRAQRWESVYEAAKRTGESPGRIQWLAWRGMIRSRVNGDAHRTGPKLQGKKRTGRLEVLAKSLDSFLSEETQKVPENEISWADAQDVYAFASRRWLKEFSYARQHPAIGKKLTTPRYKFRIPRCPRIRLRPCAVRSELNLVLAAHQLEGIPFFPHRDSRYKSKLAVASVGQRKSGRGRPKGSKRRTQSQMRADEKTLQAFRSSGARTYAEFARMRGDLNADEIKAAVDRARKDRQN